MTFEPANNPICQYVTKTDRKHNNGEARSHRVRRGTSQNQNSDSMLKLAQWHKMQYYSYM